MPRTRGEVSIERRHDGEPCPHWGGGCARAAFGNKLREHAHRKPGSSLTPPTNQSGVWWLSICAGPLMGTLVRTRGGGVWARRRRYRPTVVHTPVRPERTNTVYRGAGARGGARAAGRMCRAGARRVHSVSFYSVFGRVVTQRGVSRARVFIIGSFLRSLVSLRLSLAVRVTPAARTEEGPLSLSQSHTASLGTVVETILTQDVNSREYVARAKGQRVKAALEYGLARRTTHAARNARSLLVLGLPHRRLSRGGGPSVPHYAESSMVARRLVERAEVGTRDQFARERGCVDAAIRERDTEHSATLTTAALHCRLLAPPVEAAGGPLVRCMLAQRGAAQSGLRITTHGQSLLLANKTPQWASGVTELGEPRAGGCSTAAGDDTALD